MNPETSTAKELQNKTNPFQGQEAIEVTNEQLSKINQMLVNNPGHSNELNFLLETRATAEQVICDMEAFLYPDGEGKINGKNLLDKKIMKFIDMGEVMHGIRERIGTRASSDSL